MPLLSDVQVAALVAGDSITEATPWSSGDDFRVQAFYRGVCESLCEQLELRSVVKYVDEGYASYVEAWFYRPIAEFRVPHPTDYDEEYCGLCVLLSRLSPYFAFLQGEKGWSVNRGYSYLPSFDMVDEFPSSHVAALALQVEPLLVGRGLRRVVKPELEPLLAGDVRIETNLANGPFRQFDALFYWYD